MNQPRKNAARHPDFVSKAELRRRLAVAEATIEWLRSPWWVRAWAWVKSWL
jgi:hypothetical protein